MLPYILARVYKLEDYNDLLRVSKRIFGDTNRVNNAWKGLFRLCQANHGFGTSYAEFRRLALEEQIAEDSQLTLNENASSR